MGRNHLGREVSLILLKVADAGGLLREGQVGFGESEEYFLAFRYVLG